MDPLPHPQSDRMFPASPAAREGNMGDHAVTVSGSDRQDRTARGGSSRTARLAGPRRRAQAGCARRIGSAGTTRPPGDPRWWAATPPTSSSRSTIPTVHSRAGSPPGELRLRIVIFVDLTGQNQISLWHLLIGAKRMSTMACRGRVCSIIKSPDNDVTMGDWIGVCAG